jgi:multiple sugar transport system permease protein
MPAELYEAADIDGAGRMARFWNLTWPQLAPTTFLITITSIIGGLQGGFDSARAMTDGGPAGSTTTLAYYIYSQGFQTGDLGYASAIAWVMFVMILGITAINWKWGGQYVND